VSVLHGFANVSALDDIQASINELRFYQENIFVPLEHDIPAPEAREGPLKTAI
jgi:hypothetical protein